MQQNFVNFLKEKMKVCLAAQIFSTSIADALMNCKDNLKLLTAYQESGTIKYTISFGIAATIPWSGQNSVHIFKGLW